ncbi:hypothetical protein TNCV_884961 [Trichonephila clavipes]|nr:hypothetical protein TNCV_884961 [Trichonephila clavipes]
MPLAFMVSLLSSGKSPPDSESDLGWSLLSPSLSSLTFTRALLSSVKKTFKHQGRVYNTPLVPYHWQATKICPRALASLVSYSCRTHKYPPGQSGI